ncbi:MAG TPA: ATP-binding protein [Rhizomicrobium sp.]|jgi:SpoVK/Ycf46/Vps4 family AAA+-type ATPase|nr:ATP-binding protein [Rhizomicrobium sp.]
MRSCEDAEPISTAADWNDLVLDAEARRAVDDIVTWQKHRSELEHTPKHEHGLKRGLAVLFYGSPESAKVLAAKLIAQACGRQARRVDLAALVSKYIGETEKNLGRIFDRAAEEGWVLFFDEADALFGKRNDRAANQQIAYLLQRIEDYPGVVILSTDLSARLDEAYARRFQSVIRFEVPDVS